MNEHAKRILVVDDEKLQRIVLEAYLNRFGYRICLVSSGEEAIDVCETITPDLILLDLMMPRLDGIQTCKKLKQIESLKYTPIIMLTGKKDSLSIRHSEVHNTASIGASVFPLESEEEMHLLIGAEAAMMLSQENGGDRYTYRTNRMNIETQKRLQLLKEIRTAIDNGEFVVYYQPQIDANSMNIVGMEALVRWLHPEQGMVSPDDFIPVAEESGLIIPLGDFVLEQACYQTKKWHDMGFKLDIGVNISAQQFDAEDFVYKIEDTLKKTGLPLNSLEVEITESMAMKDYQKAVVKLHALRELGIKTSMDDFGTGYSSLSQLQTLPLDTLKVDQAFVKAIKLNEENNNKRYENSAIPYAIIAMSHSLGLKVIAEGVETVDQCRFLQQQNSEVLQGYLFSKPVPAAELNLC